MAGHQDFAQSTPALVGVQGINLAATSALQQSLCFPFTWNCFSHPDLSPPDIDPSRAQQQDSRLRRNYDVITRNYDAITKF